jgi:hypothetical protein
MSVVSGDIAGPGGVCPWRRGRPRHAVIMSAMLAALAIVPAWGTRPWPGSVAQAASAEQPAVDTDGDGMPDDWESFFGLNPQDPSDAIADPDHDGLTNLQEYQQGGHPFGVEAHYFAEGALGFFRTDIGLVNGSTTDTAKVQLTYLTESGVRFTQRLALPPMQRRTVSVNDFLAGVVGGISTIVESDHPVSADRFMEWGSDGYGSSLSGSVAAPGRTWYFAEGATSVFSLYYLLLNPGDAPAHVTITYLRELGGPVTRTYTVAAHTRATISVNDDAALASSSLGAVVSSDVPIVAERSMYLSVEPQVFRAGAAGMGSPRLSTTWLFAEGSPGGFFDEFLLLANPSATATTATIVYRRPDGTSATATYDVPAQARRTVYVNQEIATNPALVTLGASAISTTITTPVPIVAERTMWWARGGAMWYENATSLGATQPATAWTVAEGSVGGARHEQTYVLIANTTSRPGSVQVTVVTDNGSTSTQTMPIAGFGRLTLDIGAAFGLQDTHVSAFVESVDVAPVSLVVEYSRYGGSDGQIWSAGDTTLATPRSDTAPTVIATTPAAHATGVAFDTDFSVTFDEPVTVTPAAFTLECPGGTPIPLTPLTASPATTFSLHPALHLPFGNVCTLMLHAAEVTDVDPDDPPDTMTSDVAVTFTVASCPALTVSPSTLTDATTGSPYAPVAFSQTGGHGTITWTLAGGALPAGMTFSAAGLLGGTPTAAGSFTVTVRATDANGCIGEATLTLVVACSTPIVIANPAVSTWTVGMAFTAVFTQTGAQTPTFTVSSGALPAGLTLSANGVLAGTPTQTGTFTVKATASDASGCSGTGSPYSLTVMPVAHDDLYPETLLGNVPIDSDVIGYSVTASNDAVGTATIGAYDATTAHGGSVSMTTSGPNMGRFLYTPPRGYTGQDTFTYTLRDGPVASSSATVTLTVAGMVWFIDNHATCGAFCGDGRRSTPYASIAAFQAANTGTGSNPKPGDTIFIAESETPYAGSITLLNNQHLFGQDATAASFAALTGLAVPIGSGPMIPQLSPGSPFVQIEVSSGAGMTLARDNIVSGLTINTLSPAATGIIGSAGGTLTSRDVSVLGAGPAIDLSNYATTATFRSLSSTGSASSGIVLANISGTVSVTGDGATLGSGGTISGATQEGVRLTNTSGVSLAFITIQNSASAGIRVHNVSNLTLDHVHSQDNGTDAGEAAFDADGLYGTVNFIASTFRTGGDMALYLRDSSGAATPLTFTATNCTFFNSSAASVNLDDAVDLFPASVANVSYTFTGSSFTGAYRDLLHLELSENPTVQLTLIGNTFAGYDNPAMTGRGISIFNGNPTNNPNGTPFDGTLTYTIADNHITGTAGDAITVGILGLMNTSTGGTALGTITGNTIGRPTDATLAATTGGVYVFNDGGNVSGIRGTHSVRIESNLIQHVRNGGIAIYVGPSGGAQTNVNIYSNTILNFDTIFAIDARAQSSNTGDHVQLCLDLGGGGHPNTITLPLFAYADFYLFRMYDSSISMPGFTGTKDDSSAVASFLGSQNNGTGVVNVGFIPGTGGFYNAASCPTP